MCVRVHVRVNGFTCICSRLSLLSYCVCVQLPTIIPLAALLTSWRRCTPSDDIITSHTPSVPSSRHTHLQSAKPPNTPLSASQELTNRPTSTHTPLLGPTDPHAQTPVAKIPIHSAIPAAERKPNTRQHLQAACSVGRQVGFEAACVRACGSVVGVVVPGGGWASGVLASRGGLVVTNAHIWGERGHNHSLPASVQVGGSTCPTLPAYCVYTCICLPCPSLRLPQ